MGVLILRRLRHLRRTIWVIILEQRQYSGTYTHAYPYTPFPPYFVAILTFWGLFPPQMVHLLPVPNIEWAI